MQFDNPANIAVHAKTTAQEILADFPEGLDALITGVGTGGHLSGCAQVLKAAWPQLKVFAVEPVASPVISGGAPAPHPIQGIGAGFIPGNLKTELLDGVIQVDAEPAREMARRCAREEGMLVGISSGATLAGHRAEAARAAGQRPRARLQLRHRRALPVGRRVPAGMSRCHRRAPDAAGNQDQLPGRSGRDAERHGGAPARPDRTAVARARVAQATAGRITAARFSQPARRTATALLSSSGGRQKPRLEPAPSSVATPSTAKMPAAIECTSFIGIRFGEPVADEHRRHVGDQHAQRGADHHQHRRRHSAPPSQSWRSASCRPSRPGRK